MDKPKIILLHSISNVDAVKWNLLNHRKFLFHTARRYEINQSPVSALNSIYRACISYNSGLILGLRPANESRRYFGKTSLIGWAQM